MCAVLPVPPCTGWRHGHVALSQGEGCEVAFAAAVPDSCRRNPSWTVSYMSDLTLSNLPWLVTWTALMACLLCHAPWVAVESCNQQG